MEQIDKQKIQELRKVISLLKWDLDILKNKETKALKELQLKLYEQELEELLKQGGTKTAS